MSIEPKSLPQYLTDSLSNLVFSIRAAFSTPLDPDDERAQLDRGVDPDFIGWLHNDTMVTGNRANRYGKGARGYMTSNGRGSLEIGAADD